MADGLLGLGVDDVGKAFSCWVDLEIAIIAWSGKGLVVERYNDLAGLFLEDLRLFNAYIPYLLLWVFTFGTQFAANFDQIVLDTALF